MDRPYVATCIVVLSIAVAACSPKPDARKEELKGELKGESGRVYQVLGRRVDIDTSLNPPAPAVYVVFFKVESVEDVPGLSRMAEDISKAVESEAESIPVTKVAIIATKEDRVGPARYGSTYGFRFKKDPSGVWRALDSKS